MRKIAIVGGGQSGLQLALGLLQKKYEVTVVSNRTPEQIFNGRVTSSQFMFHDSLQNERDLKINFWEKACPITEGIAFTIPGPDKTRALFWEARLDGYGQSVDQRVKFAGWMKEFAKRGGDLVIKDAGPQDVDGYAKSHDLVLVAAGKGEINRMFERDAEKSPFPGLQGINPDKPAERPAFHHQRGPAAGGSERGWVHVQRPHGQPGAQYLPG